MVATHRYALPGEYIVTMTVMDIYGGMNATNRLVKVSLSPVDAPDIDLDVDPPPIAVLDLTRSSIEIDDPVLFLASRSFDPEGGPIEYMYDFGDGSSTEWVYEDYAIHAYDEPGDYNVTLMVIDEALQTNRTIPVMVHVRPRATVNHPPTLSIRRTQDSLTVNQTLIIIVYVNDPDNEPVEVMLVTAPEGMVVVDNRYIRWRPNAKQAGLHRIEVEAVDSRTSVRTTFSIWVDPIQSKAPSETSRRTETDTFGLQPVEDMDVVFMVFLFSGVGLAITITLFMFVRRARQRGQGRKGRRGGKGRKRHKGPLMPER
jgi:PKD repeat protein